jgi:hypothetical protein
VFIAATIGFAIHLSLLIRADRHRVEQSNNRFINAAWTSAGYGIFAFWIAVTLLAYRSGEAAVLNTISLAVLCAYGIVWWLCSVVTGHQWMKGIAILSFLSMLVIAALVNTAFVWLAYGFAIVASALLPGIYISRAQNAKA